MSEQDRLRKRLEICLKRDDNRHCCDCGMREPRWASANLGIFVCLACSGIHRNLGVHISFVRSVNLDSWKLEQVEKMERMGNAFAKEFYEAEVPPGYRIPGEHASVREMEKWIRDKYEHKKFVPRNGAPPPTGRAPPPPSSSSSTSKRQEQPRPRRGEREPQIQRATGGRPRTVQKVTEKSPSPQPVVDLLSFDVPSAEPTKASVAPYQQAMPAYSQQVQPSPPPPPQQQHNDFAGFGDFQQAPAPAPHLAAQSVSQFASFPAAASAMQHQQQHRVPLQSTGNSQPHDSNPFGDFQSAPASQVQQPPAVSTPPVSQSSTDAIMSMFNVPKQNFNYVHAGQMHAGSMTPSMSMGPAGSAMGMGGAGMSGTSPVYPQPNGWSSSAGPLQSGSSSMGMNNHGMMMMVPQQQSNPMIGGGLLPNGGAVMAGGNIAMPAPQAQQWMAQQQQQQQQQTAQNENYMGFDGLSTADTNPMMPTTVMQPASFPGGF